jgi:transposase InsO family protein
MEIELIDEGKRRLNVSGVLGKLGASRSGYYAWRKRLPSEQAKRKAALKEMILAIHNESHQNYGAPKITKELRKKGKTVSEKTVGNYMREMGIKAQYVKPYTATTIDPDFDGKLRNILDEEFNPDAPNAVWCSDITYIWTFAGFAYLTSVMDLFSRKIVAWTLSTTLEAAWVVEAVRKAIRERGVKPRVFHSDRGCQYVSSQFREITAGIALSYSAKANPWDNACIESFHALIKREWLNRYKIFDYNHAYRLVFEYINTFYNTVRIHSHCGYLSPDQYEAEYERGLGGLQKLAS